MTIEFFVMVKNGVGYDPDTLEDAVKVSRIVFLLNGAKYLFMPIMCTLLLFKGTIIFAKKYFPSSSVINKHGSININFFSLYRME